MPFSKYFLSDVSILETSEAYFTSLGRRLEQKSNNPEFEWKDCVELTKDILLQ
jgi:hypothetical protein